MLDKHDAIASIEGMSARLSLAIPGYPEVRLESEGDHFQGKGPEISRDHALVTLRLEKDGKSDTARVKLHLEEGPVGHHHGAK
ncbi:MAG: hypothetical protein IPI67_24050 [Myxococcales bacterium]|nr:hypothetical protein [Myxococcales bacterium]